MIFKITESKLFIKQIQKALPMIKAKYYLWRDTVQYDGLKIAQSQRTWRDHQLAGDRKDERSITLGGKWRAIYCIKTDGTIEFIEMLEVTPHDY